MLSSIFSLLDCIPVRKAVLVGYYFVQLFRSTEARRFASKQHAQLTVSGCLPVCGAASMFPAPQNEVYCLFIDFKGPAFNIIEELIFETSYSKCGGVLQNTIYAI